MADTFRMSDTLAKGFDSSAYEALKQRVGLLKKEHNKAVKSQKDVKEVSKMLMCWCLTQASGVQHQWLFYLSTCCASTDRDCGYIAVEAAERGGSPSVGG